ncbi:MAG TPA: RNA polymerase sigma factor [Candidatus Omnitrophota bacterium]|nr:RNA polymerase sigma factor [Candidatus Omnitrophota bacterium]
MKNIAPELIKKAAEGETSAFEEIYRQTCGFVYSIALRVLGNRSEAEDVTQEVFIKVYNNLKNFAFRSALSTWIYRITMNVTLNTRKKFSRYTDKSVEYDDDIHSQVFTQDAEVNPDHPDREALLAGLLSGLSPEHRACIILREIEGLSYEEMADALHININTVRSRLARAREALLAAGSKRGEER